MTPDELKAMSTTPSVVLSILIVSVLVGFVVAMTHAAVRSGVEMARSFPLTCECRE